MGCSNDEGSDSCMHQDTSSLLRIPWLKKPSLTSCTVVAGLLKGLIRADITEMLTRSWNTVVKY